MFSTLLSLVLTLAMSGGARALLVRQDVDQLRPEQVFSLQKALRLVHDDQSEKGYAAIAAYHGYPAQCQDGDKPVACCVHGQHTFPQWHRLYLVQLEQALKDKDL